MQIRTHGAFGGQLGKVAPKQALLLAPESQVIFDQKPVPPLRPLHAPSPLHSSWHSFPSGQSTPPPLAVLVIFSTSDDDSPSVVGEAMSITAVEDSPVEAAAPALCSLSTNQCVSKRAQHSALCENERGESDAQHCETERGESGTRGLR